jgi:hypothetical protein
MTHYRKRPVEIKAFQWFDQMLDEWPDWAYRDVQEGKLNSSRAINHLGDPILTIHTHEGNSTAAMGDWVIRGLRGEYSACREKVFLELYEAVEGDE